jgi:hypothetical protein
VRVGEKLVGVNRYHINEQALILLLIRPSERAILSLHVLRIRRISSNENSNSVQIPA